MIIKTLEWKSNLIITGLSLCHMTAWTHDQPADQATFGNDSVTESLIPTIAVTDSTGKVTLLRIDGSKVLARSIDTKGGNITSIAVDRIAPNKASDIVVGNSDGLISIILNARHVFGRRNIGSPVNAVAVQAVKGSEALIVVGDTFGTVTALNLHGSVAWRVRLRDVALMDNLKLKNTFEPRTTCDMIRCVHATSILDTEGVLSHYVLVCDGTPFVYFMSEGECVFSLSAPCIINTICHGEFFKRGQKQIAIGGEDGIIYIIDEYFNLVEYINVHHPITRLVAWSSVLFDDDALDLLLCAGHFSSLNIYKRRELFECINTASWCWGIGVSVHEGVSEFAVSLLNNTVHAYRMVNEEGEI